MDGEAFLKLLMDPTTSDWSELDPPVSAVRRMVELLRALHNMGIVHGDMKPSNYVYAGKDESKKMRHLHMIDFEMSSFHSGPASVPETVREAMRKAGFGANVAQYVEETKERCVTHGLDDAQTKMVLSFSRLVLNGSLPPEHAQEIMAKVKHNLPDRDDSYQSLYDYLSVVFYPRETLRQFVDPFKDGIHVTSAEPNSWQALVQYACAMEGIHARKQFAYVHLKHYASLWPRLTKYIRTIRSVFDADIKELSSKEKFVRLFVQGVPGCEALWRVATMLMDPTVQHANVDMRFADALGLWWMVLVTLFSCTTVPVVVMQKVLEGVCKEFAYVFQMSVYDRVAEFVTRADEFYGEKPLTWILDGKFDSDSTSGSSSSSGPQSSESDAEAPDDARELQGEKRARSTTDVSGKERKRHKAAESGEPGESGE